MESTDVIICGCGPTGAMLSSYLGQHSVRNIVLERENEITQDPRGIALDEDGIRYLQGLGLYDKVFSEIGQKMGYFNFISSATNLHATPFLRFNYDTTEGGTAHPGFMCHKQPVMERCLREVVSAQPMSELRSGSTVMSIEETDDDVIVTYSTSTGEEKQLRAKFLVGADGKTGFTRKKYLEPRGVTMEKDDKFKYEEAWVALNWKITPPTRETHPEFPLWKLGFTPEQVYDSFFPPEFRFICNPDRPSVCGRFGLRDDHLWRFEFVVREGEDGSEMAKYENVRSVVNPYLTHSKEKYNLNEEVLFPEDCIEIIRSRPFNFSARSCNKWSLGRVLLCGDAAHVFPPFGGQGIASGFRDAISVAWRLAIACRPGFQQHENLFKAWYGERKQQLEMSLAATITNGNLCNERSAVKTFLRDWYLWFRQLLPSWRHQLELGPRADGLTKYAWQAGFPFLAAKNGGRTLPQVFCLPYYSTLKKPLFTDDVIFSKHKTGLFQLVILLDSPNDMKAARADLEYLEQEGVEQFFKVNEATYLAHYDTPSYDIVAKASLGSDHFENAAFRVIRSESSDPGIWADLPDPRGYDGWRLKREVAGKYAIVRPDRFIFAVCNSRLELLEAAKALTGMFGSA